MLLVLELMMGDDEIHKGIVQHLGFDLGQQEICVYRNDYLKQDLADYYREDYAARQEQVERLAKFWLLNLLIQ